MIEYISQLPTEYQEVEYIQSSGTQYIDTGYKPTSNNLRVVCDFEYTADHSASSVFGSESSGHYSIVPWGAPDFYVGSSTQLLTQTTALNIKYALDVHANAGTLTVSLNGKTNSASYSGSILTTVNMGIFCNIIAGVASQFCSMKLYAMYIYDNSNLVRDFVPCYRKSDNVAGLYDLVNNVFYTNAGSGVFAVGADSNKHAIATIIPGGVISFGAALRRRMMSKKPSLQWTLTVVSTVAKFATVSINGESLTAGSYVVDDGTIASFVATGSLSNSIYLDGVKVGTTSYDLEMHANYTATSAYQSISTKWEITTQP